MRRGGLSVFLPWSVDGLLKGAVAGCAPRKSEEGCVLFCDVAGFTPLTEALSVLGREGAEELTRLLNGYFTEMIGILEEEGGDVLRFGGDAMTVFFPGDSRERAARSALRMMEAMEPFSSLPTRAGVFGLSMKIGAAYGEVHLGLVGSPEEGWDYYAAGSPLDDAADAEHHAVPGRIILHPSFLSKAPEGLRAEAMEGGYARLMSVSGEAPPPVEPPSPPDAALLQAVVPRHLADRAGEGSIGEHRGTAVVFLAIQGLSWDDPAAAHERLRRLYSRFAGVSQKYGGNLNKMDFGDKGAKAIFLFGVPFACERKEEMATRAALELLAPSGATSGMRLRAGITSAPLFSGPVGSPSRREFTVMGDGINLSARLMAASAEGESLASREVAEGAGTALRFLTLAPVTVKGKRDPVPIFAPKGERSDSHAETGLLLEREVAQGALRQSLFDGKGKPPLFEAPAGMGKSALAAWALREARAREIPALWVPLAPFSTGRAFGAFRALVRVLLGAEKGDSPEKLARLRDMALAEEEPGYRVVLNPVLELPEESSSALKGLSPKERKELSFAVVKRLLDRGGERVVLVDGLHWADPLSLDLLAFLLADATEAPWRLALFSRPGVATQNLRASAEPLPLEPLSDSASRILLEEGHRLSGLSATGLAWFARKAGGNPALCAALVRSLEEAGLLREEAGGSRRLDEDRLASTAFPDTLEGLYLRQVDALSSTERQVLQEAAVLGYSVSLNVLGRISAVVGEARREALQNLLAKGMLREDCRGERPYASFSETLLREAVYGAIPFGQRRPVHKRVLEALVEMEGEGASHLWPTLAYHAEQGGEEGLARRFHRLAGRDALDRFDNLSALAHLEFLCAAPSTEPEDVEDAFRLMDVYGNLGRWAEAQPLLERLASVAGQLPLLQAARLRNYLGQDAASRQEWAKVEEILKEGLRLAEAAKDVNLQGRFLVNLVGRLYGPTGQLDNAKEALEKALALPKGQGQAAWRVTAAMNLGVVLWHRGQLADAERALKGAYRESVRGKLGPQKGMISDNLCALSGELGHFEEATRWGRVALSALSTFAVRGVYQNACYNLALAYLAVGKTRDGETLLHGINNLAVSQGNTLLEGCSKEGLAQARALEGDINAVFELSRSALTVFRSVGAARDFRFTLLVVGNLLRALSGKRQWLHFFHENKAQEYLLESPGDIRTDGALAQMDRWATQGALLVHEGSSADSPEERLEQLLWQAEEGNAVPVQTLHEFSSRWPYFDARLRVLRLEHLSEEKLGLPRKAEALRLLSRCMGGIWGLRLLCLLYEREPSKAKARALRQRALRALYFIHGHSPEWAWEKVVAFPEVKAVLRGFKA